jgi:general secretion pathway protein J
MLRGMMAVQGSCGGVPVAFQGTESVMRFVSSYSLNEGSRGRPQIVELISQQKTDGTGIRLVVNEYPYLGRNSLQMVCAQPPQVRQSSFILADQLAVCRFFFKALDPGSGSETWTPAWMIPAWPRGVRIEMQPRKLGENKLQSSTLSVPIMVRRAQVE